MGIDFGALAQKQDEQLTLVDELQSILADALNSLGNRTPPSIESAYMGWMAKQMNCAVDAHVHLKKSGRNHASNLMVRPALECVFLMSAADRNREFLFRQALTEHRKESKFFGANTPESLRLEADLRKLKGEFQSAGYPTVEQQLQIKEVAQMANLEKEYNGHYALFCKFTHGALRATMGDLDDADSFASLCVALNTIRALRLLKKHSASVPELEEHERRMLELLRIGNGIAG